MPRTARLAPAGTIFHVLNRGVGRRQLSDDDGDLAAFERCLAHALAAVPEVVLPAYCLTPDHGHLLARPTTGDALGRFTHGLTVTHTRRWQGHRGTVGHGHLYQGRFKRFPVQDDRHLLTVARRAERNPLRAGLVEAAERWPWSNLARRSGDLRGRANLPLAAWPVAWDGDRTAFVNGPQTDGELAELRAAIDKGRPFGTADRRPATGDDPPPRPTVDRAADGSAAENEGAGVESAPVPLFCPRTRRKWK